MNTPTDKQIINVENWEDPTEWEYLKMWLSPNELSEEEYRRIKVLVKSVENQALQKQREKIASEISKVEIILPQNMYEIVIPKNTWKILKKRILNPSLSTSDSLDET